MKKAVRLLCLFAFVSLAMLPNAHAGDCSIRCGTTSWNGYTANGWDCCALFDQLCGGSGYATYDGAYCFV